MEPTAPWTLDELTRRVADALSVDYDGQLSGRVRDVPDQRAIRWYTTLGLVDRPAAMRGRTALYGPRHLRQLVAIKRLQSGGLSLAAVQAELAGASEADLERIAQLPTTAAPVAAAHRPEGSHGAAEAGGSTPGGTGRVRPALAEPVAPAGARRFWASPPADPPAAVAAPRGVPVWPRRPPRPSRAPTAAHLQGIRLGDEVTLLIGAWRPVDADDVRALHAAALPLLEALHARGLVRLGHEPGPGSPDDERELP